MWTRAELKENAKKYFKFNYWKMVLVAFIISLVGGGGSSSSASGRTVQEISSDSYMPPSEVAAFLLGFSVVLLVLLVIAFALMVFLLNPLEVGAQRFFVVSHYQKAELGELGYAFSNSYMNVVKTMFLRQLYIFLWSLLFIVPGIIKDYEYRMIPYILAENPGISSKEAFAMSKQMMDGNKWNAFVLDLSFFGWVFLSAFTCGILAIFYVNPYMLMTDAELYVALKEITFGNRNTGYQNFQQNQNYQNYQNYQSYQPNQNYQNYQPNQNYQSYQPNQNYQNYQSNQNYQSYQPNQSYQGNQSNQNYQSGQSYQPDQSYQSYQSNQNYQNYQPGQNYQSGQDNQGYQDAGWQSGSPTNNDQQNNDYRL
ncbi:MAG: DUF975 family protein [Eubacterium sp.]|nr:DUF975 family protein [Eubacterium sp.]